MGYLFGPFRLDVARRILFAGAVPTPIPERLFHILVLLLDARGETVDRETLSLKVWGEEGVTDSNLTQHVYLLRMLLGETKNERQYIATVPGAGYRFVAPIARAEDETPRRTRDLPIEQTADLVGRYCQASYLLVRATPESLREAAAAFDACLKLDPLFAPALIGTARAHIVAASEGFADALAVAPAARGSIARAIEREPQSASAHAVLAELALHFDWDWQKCKREFSMAIGLNPHSALPRQVAATYYMLQGDAETAFSEARHALAVEPGSLPHQVLVARSLLHGGHAGRAIGMLSNVLAAEPHYAPAKRLRGIALLLDRDPSAACADLAGAPALLARAHADAGDRDKAESLYRRCIEGPAPFVSQFELAIASAGLAHYDRTIRHLREAMERKEPGVLTLRTLRWFRSFEGSTEFERLVRRIPRLPAAA